MAKTKVFLINFVFLFLRHGHAARLVKILVQNQNVTVIILYCIEETRAVTASNKPTPGITDRL